MINLNYKTFKDKVYACWVGKNIGGTMGTPYEGIKDMVNIKGFVTKPNEVLPNDDLDLQLVWLHLVETIGVRAINAKTLGEGWLSFIHPTWNEYGIGKANMLKGLIPPLSGDYNNDWKNSNGAWIRTEIWASLAPGCPDVAAKYAIEDAKVDHGSGEGTFAAAFVAAMQSAAFVINDLRKCIEIGLSKIPNTSRVHNSVLKVLECFDNNIDVVSTRNIILELNKDIGTGWFEAPSNVAYTILGLLYGKGDFKKSMIYAINCGDDTDCTGATVGSTLGILGGLEIIPKDWKGHIGDNIVTAALCCGNVLRGLPKTCTELTERVVKQTTNMLLNNNCDVIISNNEDKIDDNIYDKMINNQDYQDILDEIKPNSMKFSNGFSDAIVEVVDGVDINPNQEKEIKIRFKNTIKAYDYQIYNLQFRWWVPNGFTVLGKKSVTLMHKNDHQVGFIDVKFIVKTCEELEAVNRLVLEVEAVNRPTALYIPIKLLG